MYFHQAVFPKIIKTQNDSQKTTKLKKIISFRGGCGNEDELRNASILTDLIFPPPANQSDQKLRKIGTRLDFKRKIISNRNKHLSKLEKLYSKSFTKKKKIEKNPDLMEVLKEGSRCNRSLNNQNKRCSDSSFTCYSASFMGDRMRREHENYIGKHLNSPINGTNNSVVGELFERQTNIFNELCNKQNNNTTHVDLNKKTSTKSEPSTINLTYYGPPEPCTRGGMKKVEQKTEEQVGGTSCYPCCFPCCSCCLDPRYPTFAPIINYTPAPVTFAIDPQDDDPPCKITSTRSTQCCPEDDPLGDFVCNQAEAIENMGIFIDNCCPTYLAEDEVLEKKNKTFQPKVTIRGSLWDNIKKNPKYTTEVSLKKNYTNQMFKQARREFRSCTPECDMSFVFKTCPKNPFEKGLQMQDDGDEDGKILVPSNIKRYNDSQFLELQKDMNCSSMIFDSWKKSCSRNEVNDCNHFEALINKKLMTKDEYRKSFLERLKKLDLTVEDCKLLSGELQDSSNMKKDKNQEENESGKEFSDRLPRSKRDTSVSSTQRNSDFSDKKIANKKKSSMTNAESKKSSRGTKNVQIEDSSKLTQDTTLDFQDFAKKCSNSDAVANPEAFKLTSEVKPSCSGCEFEDNMLKNIPPCCVSPQTHSEIIQGFPKKLTKDLNCTKPSYPSFNNGTDEPPPFCTVQKGDQSCKNRCEKSSFNTTLTRPPRYPRKFEGMGLLPRPSNKSTQELIEKQERDFISRKCFESLKMDRVSPKRGRKETIEQAKVRSIRKKENSPPESRKNLSSLPSFETVKNKKPSFAKPRNPQTPPTTKRPSNRGKESVHSGKRKHKSPTFSSQKPRNLSHKNHSPNKEKCQKSASEESFGIATSAPQPLLQLSQRTFSARESHRKDSTQKHSSRKESTQKHSSHKDSTQKHSSRKDSTQKHSSRKDLSHKFLFREKSPLRLPYQKNSPQEFLFRKDSSQKFPSHRFSPQKEEPQKLSSHRESFRRISSNKETPKLLFCSKDFPKNFSSCKDSCRKVSLLKRTSQKISSHRHQTQNSPPRSHSSHSLPPSEAIKRSSKKDICRRSSCKDPQNSRTTSLGKKDESLKKQSKKEKEEKEGEFDIFEDLEAEKNIFDP